MCGRFTETATIEKLARDLNIPRDFFPRKIVPRYNIAPSFPVLTIREQAGFKIDFMKWGLIPSWAKDPAIGNRMINARSETVADKPSFRSPFKKNRCLIPADGFYEWKKEGKAKQPYYIRMKSGEVFTFAGLWSHWKSPDGSEVVSCTILTTGPNPLMQPIHDRMPVIIAPSKRSEWLDVTTFNPESLMVLLKPYPEKEMDAYPVTTYVNKPDHDSEECLARKT